MTLGVRIEVTTYLEESEIGSVAILTERVTEADGVRPLSEQAMLRVLEADLDQHRASDQLHVCAWRVGQLEAQLIGYANVDTSDQVNGASIELAVLPMARETGVGDQILDRAVTEAGLPVNVWAHGAHSPTQELAEARGFALRRRLFQMRRSLLQELPPVKLPAGISIRSFDAAKDSFNWLALNARAFVDLPDQGGWGPHDLRSRLASDWFDPGGFILAFETDDDGNEAALVGFHWTKIHGNETGATFGEVYVIAVDPQLHARGLGKELALLGLRYLKDRGLPEVMLYVDSSNAGAIKLYERLGFVKKDEDSLFYLEAGSDSLHSG